MINRTVVESFLKANGLGADATDDAIKSILFSARWHENDVETALMVLRENQATQQQYVHAMHKVLCDDSRLQPETISALLGIDVDILPAAQRGTQTGVGTRAIFITMLYAFGVAGLFLLGALWYLKTGLFQPLA